MKIPPHVTALLILVGVAVQFARGGSHDVKTQVFGGEANFAAFMSAKDMTMERLHAIAIDSEHPYPRDAWDLSCYRREAPMRLSAEQVKNVKNLLREPSAYGWDFAKACLPDYGVLLQAIPTRRSKSRYALSATCLRYSLAIN